jgi:hypothetical protein
MNKLPLARLAAFALVALSFALAPRATAQGYDYILPWSSFGSTNYLQVGYFTNGQINYDPARWGFGNIVNLDRPEGLILEAINFEATNYVSTFHSSPIASFTLSLYTADESLIAEHFFPSVALEGSGYFFLGRFSTHVPQNFRWMVRNDSAITTSFQVPTTTQQLAQWNGPQGNITAFSDPSRYYSVTQGRIDSQGPAFTLGGSVPEPSTYALLLMTGAGALWWARQRR